MVEPILIWGAGAMGGTLGAYWARAGVDVLMVDIDREHTKACSTSGLIIEGPVESFTQIVPAVTPEQLKGQYSRIVLAVKAHHTAAAVEQLAPHLKADGFVVSMQNGLNELIIAKTVGDERTMGCFVNFGADWHGPGEILFGNRGAVVIGEIDGSTRDRTRDIYALFKIFEPEAILTEDVWGYLWGKLGYGAMLFGTALTNDSMTENFDDPARSNIWIALGREVMAVAQAKGVISKGFNGFEPQAYMPGIADEEALKSIAALAEFNRFTAKSHSGIWRDLAVRKRKTEVDAQVSIISEVGAECDVETPLLHRMAELIHDIEEGRREQSLETLYRLKNLCT